MTTVVLLVAASPVEGLVLTRELSRSEDLDVRCVVADTFEARRLLVRAQPSVVVLDMNLPGDDAIGFLRAVAAHHPRPVVALVSPGAAGHETAVRALQAGAIDTVTKPGPGTSFTVLAGVLLTAIRDAATAGPGAGGRLRPARRHAFLGAQHPKPRRAVVLGASLGGPAAIEAILRAMPPGGPAMVAGIHMPAGHTASFARRLDSLCRMRVAEAGNGDRVEAGVCLIAPGGMHTLVRGTPGSPSVTLRPPLAARGYVPSLDALFESVARSLAGAAVGVILTGMGADGAAGLRAMRDAGAATVAQDEASSVVFGMPGEAVKAGAADHVAALDDIPALVLRLAGEAFPARDVP